VQKRRPRPGDFQEGLYYILNGLFRKVVIGDNMASVANAIFAADVSTLSGLECLVGVYAFAFQIYADFSGYSSIAQGLAKWMGIDLMTNFRMPYFAVSPSDFWRRWHISLSTWLRDYVYISLGGNRGGRLLIYRNLMITMLLGGLWHGANWTFVAWGAFHGVLLCGYRMLAGEKDAGEARAHPLRSLASAFVMFQFVAIGWLLFRADTIGQAWRMFVKIVTDPRPTALAGSAFALILFYAGPLLAFEFWLERRKELAALVKVEWLPRALAYTYCALMLVYFPAPVAHEFIYFQF
jgi:D-alanyl-lipoteichoic acid acyltransferase DltB (MBOAT superfamily)